MRTSSKLTAEFTQLYTTEADAIFRYCFIRTSQREVARDLTQDTFMRLWNTLSGDKEIRNCRAFLFTVARNLIIDWYRKKKPESLDILVEEEGGDVFLMTEDTDFMALEMAS